MTEADQLRLTSLYAAISQVSYVRACLQLQLDVYQPLKAMLQMRC